MSPEPNPTLFPRARSRRDRSANASRRLAPAAPAPGELVAGRYELERQIGEGGMGSVWAARDRALDLRCALKFLRWELVADAGVRSRFEREAAIVARIRSNHVAQVFNRGEWRGLPFIAMEYLEGEDLASRLCREGPLEPWQTYEVVAQIARALTLVHARGVVHRDIKPGNIFLVPDEQGPTAKLLDFGVAKQPLPSPMGVSTSAGVFVGTADYASPEQLLGESVDWRSDLWSLAVVAFECLTGWQPFEADSLGELCAAVLHKPLPRLEEYGNGFPAELEAWFERAFARDPARRFQSARELADALADTLACVRATLPSLPPRATLESHPPEDVSRALAPEPRRFGFWRTLSLMSVLVALGFVGGLHVAGAGGPKMVTGEPPHVATAGMLALAR